MYNTMVVNPVHDPILASAEEAMQRAVDKIKSMVNMAITHVVGLRNVLADAVDNYINTNTPLTDAFGDLVLFDAATEVVRINLQNPAFGVAGTGVITLLGVPLSNAAVAAGTVDLFEIQDRDNATVIDGTVTLTSGGGDIELDNTNVAISQTVQITSLTYTAPV